VAKKKMDEPSSEAEGFLTSAARSVGHAAGEAAKALGLEAAETATAMKAPARKGAKPRSAKPKIAKRTSARAQRGARAAEAKNAASKLAKSAGSSDARYRRIMGKAPAIWSQEDVDYIERLASSKEQGAPA
jgi:hypothetical protein